MTFVILRSCVALEKRSSIVKPLTILALVIAAVLSPRRLWAQASSAGVVPTFERRCVSCHDNVGPESTAPSREGLRQFTPERVFEALTTGSMAPNATGLSDDEKRAIAELATGQPFAGSAAPGGMAARAVSAMKNQRSVSLKLDKPWSWPRWNG